jgi:hypothetical protein
MRVSDCELCIALQAHAFAKFGWIKNFGRGALEQDELSLNRLLIPFVPAEAGTQSFGRILGPWVPASAGTNGDWFNGGTNLNSSALVNSLI